jgi:uncharacterized caspase-like protein
MKSTIENTQTVIALVLAGNERAGTTFIKTDGIASDADGKAMAQWLTSCGFEVVNHFDIKTCGLVELTNGVMVSTNGYVYKA